MSGYEMAVILMSFRHLTQGTTEHLSRDRAACFAHATHPLRSALGNRREAAAQTVEAGIADNLRQVRSSAATVSHANG
jgi:hypothetical protein